MSAPRPQSPHLSPDGDGSGDDVMAEDKASRSSHETGGRKSSKPLMEKRRRARINHCLTELQTILEALNPESVNSRQSKREKADILEQTVRLVKELRQRGTRGHAGDPHSQVQFRAGFNECMATVTQFLSINQSSLNVDAKTDLMSHLANSLQCANKVMPDRSSLPQPRRLVEDSTNNGGPTIRLQHAQSTPSQSEAVNNNSSMNVVRPMPAAVVTAPSTVSPTLPAPSVPTTVSVPTNGQLPVHSAPGPSLGLPSRVEVPQGGRAGAGAGAGMRLIPIGIPIKVQSAMSAGQIVLVPSNFNGNQFATQYIPVLSPPATTLAALGPASSSSTGSSGSVAVSPPLRSEQKHQSPSRTSTQAQHVTAAVSTRPSPGAGAAIMYAASYPAAAMGARAETNGVNIAGAHAAHAHPTAAAPYPVAFVAMQGDPGENGMVAGHFEQLMYQQMPGFYQYLPANGPNDEEPMWRPW